MHWACCSLARRAAERAPQFVLRREENRSCKKEIAIVLLLLFFGQMFIVALMAPRFALAHPSALKRKKAQTQRTDDDDDDDDDTHSLEGAFAPPARAARPQTTRGRKGPAKH